MTVTCAAAVPPAHHHMDSILGHDVLKTYLRNAHQTNVLPHALLCMGPAGIGKTSMAHALAKLVNCHAGSPGNCACDACRKISDGVFADLLIVEPQGASGQITLAGWKPGSEDAAAGVPPYYRFVDSRPLEGRRKVLIMRQADRMNVALANYLLKLIEEPPSSLLIVLVTSRPSNLLATIRSRCAPVRFCPLGSEIMYGLAGQLAAGQPQAQRNMLVQFAQGCPGRMVTLAAETASGSPRHDVARQMRLFQQYGFPALFGVASRLAKTGTALMGGGSAQDGFEAVLNLLQLWLRDALITKSCSEAAEKLIVCSDLLTQLREYAGAVSEEALVEAADCVRRAAEHVPRMTDRAYVLEQMLYGIGRAGRR